MRLYQRKYIWQLPVRLWHWVHFCCLVVLSVTGYYIGAPFVSPSAAFTLSAEGVQVMSAMRVAHFLAAAVLTLVVIWRLYWFIVGNEYAHWRSWVPATSRKELVEWLGHLREQARFYLFLRRDLPEQLGHKPLASLAYIASMGMLVAQVLTGWALYGEVNPDGWAWRLFGWVFSTMRRQWLRYLHHALMWALIAFFVAHVYMAIRDEVLGSAGTMTAMISGFKYEEAKEGK